MFVHICNFCMLPSNYMLRALFAHLRKITWLLACNILDYLNICSSKYLAFHLNLLFHGYIFSCSQHAHKTFEKLFSEKDTSFVSILFNYTHAHVTSHTTWQGKFHWKLEYLSVMWNLR